MYVYIHNTLFPDRTYSRTFQAELVITQLNSLRSRAKLELELRHDESSFDRTGPSRARILHEQVKLTITLIQRTNEGLCYIVIFQSLLS